MKIAMIGHKRVPSREGGVEIVVEELSTRLAEKGHQVDVYNRKGKNVQDKNVDKDKKGLKKYKGIKLITIPTINKKGIDALLYSFFATIRAVVKKYDVIHYHAEGPCAMLWIPRLFGIKTVATIHGLDWQRSKWGGLATKYIKLGEKIAAKYADEIIVLSKGVQKYFKDTYNRDTIFIPNGVNKPEIKKADVIKEKWGLEKDNYILFLARIVPEKGLHYLIDAYKQIHTDKKLVIAGGASHTNSYLEEIKEKVKDDKNIIMTGFVQGQELEELYSNCYLYCLPSDVEGMPISLLEAMSYGRNCLVSNIEENTQVTQGHALTFENGNIEDLKEKLEYSIKNESSNKEEKDKIQNLILSNYKWDDVVKETEKLYKTSDEIKNRRKSFIAFICAIISSIIFFVSYNLINNDIALSIVFTLNYICYFICVLKLSNNNFLTPILLFFIFFSVFVGISPIAYYAVEKHLNKSQLILISISVLIYIFAIFIGKAFQNKKDRKVIKKQEIDTNYIKYISYFLLVISLVGYCIYFIKNKDLLFSGNLENGRILALAGNGIIIQMMNLSTIGICMLLELALNKKYSLKKVVCFLIVFSIFTLMRGFRSAIVAPIVICFLMFNKKNKISNKTIIKTGVILLLGVSVLRIFRTLASSSNVDIIASIMTTFKNGSINLEYILQRFGKSITFQYGYTYLINLKMLLPGPDVDFTLWLKEIMNIKFAGGGITPTIIGEFYMNFGVIGVYIGTFFIGLLVNKLDNFYESSNQIFYSSFLTFNIVNVVSGGISNVEVYLLITSIVYFVLYVWGVNIKNLINVRKLENYEKK